MNLRGSRIFNAEAQRGGGAEFCLFFLLEAFSSLILHPFYRLLEDL